MGLATRIPTTGAARLLTEEFTAAMDAVSRRKIKNLDFVLWVALDILVKLIQIFNF
jgi:hypothetical protein